MADHDDENATTMRFTPLFNGYFEGSLMNENVPTRYLFGWLIAQSQRPGANGVVDVPMSHIARTLNMSLEGSEGVREGIRRLMEPDPDSRCKAEEGRRIVPLDPSSPDRGWRVVAHKNYKEEVHNALSASRMRALYHKRKGGLPNVPKLPNVPNLPKPSHETKRNETKSKRGRSPLLPSGEVISEGGERASRFAPPSLAEVREYGKELPGLDAAAFHDFYASKGWKVGSQPMKDWRAAARNWRRRDAGNGKDAPRVVIHKNQGDIDREREGDEIARNRAAATRERQEREAAENGWAPPDTPEERAESERLLKLREAQLAGEKP